MHAFSSVYSGSRILQQSFRILISGKQPLHAEVTSEGATPSGDILDSKPPDLNIQVEDENISCVAYVVNLSYETEFFKLRETFAQHGEVKKVFIPRNRKTGQNKGIAFVTMSSEDERDHVITQLNECEIDGRTIYVDKAKPRGEIVERKMSQEADFSKLYIGNLSYETTAEDLNAAFSEIGEVSNIYIPVDRYSGSPRGFAFVAMNHDDAEKVIQAFDGSIMDGRTIEVKFSLPRGTKAPRRKNEIKLYVGNISFDTEEEGLRDLFEKYGPVIDLYVPTDQQTGRPRGFAFVSLEPAMAERAIEEIDNYELDGRFLRVNEAQPKGSRGGYNDVPNEW